MAILQPKESDGDIFSCLLNHTALIAKAGFRLDSTLNDRNWNFSNQGWHLKCHYWFIWEHYASYQSFEGLDETLVSVSKRPRNWVKFLVILFVLVLMMLPEEGSDEFFKQFSWSWTFFGHFFSKSWWFFLMVIFDIWPSTYLPLLCSLSRSRWRPYAVSVS